jgi:hypothetical protein
MQHQDFKGFNHAAEPALIRRSSFASGERILAHAKSFGGAHDCSAL